MLLLLPLTLMTSSTQKLTALGLGVPGPDEVLPPELPGMIERLEVRRTNTGYAITAAVRSTDVLAGAGDVEIKSFQAAHLAELQGVLRQLKALAPARERVTLIPLPDTPAEELVAWMDSVRADASGELLPRVILGDGR